MPKKKYNIDLAVDEREQLSQLVRRDKHSSRQVTRARILLLAADSATMNRLSPLSPVASTRSSARAVGSWKQGWGV